MTTVRLFRRKATNYQDATRLIVRGNRTGAHMEMWSDGIRVSTLPVDVGVSPEALIADIHGLRAQWRLITAPNQGTTA